MYLRCGKNEYYVLGRLFQNFKQGVKRLVRKHMNLVHNIDPVFSLCRCKAGFFDYFTNVVNASVAGGVHFNNIQNLALFNAQAVFALSAGVSVFGVKAIYSFSKYFCTGCFACTS